MFDCMIQFDNFCLDELRGGIEMSGGLNPAAYVDGRDKVVFQIPDSPEIPDGTADVPTWREKCIRDHCLRYRFECAPANNYCVFERESRSGGIPTYVHVRAESRAEILLTFRRISYNVGGEFVRLTDIFMD